MAPPWSGPAQGRRRPARRGITFLAVTLLLALALALLTDVDPSDRSASSAPSPTAHTASQPAPEQAALTLSPIPPPDTSASTEPVDDEYVEDEVGVATIYTSCVTPDRGAEVQVNSNEWDTTRGELVWILELDGVEIIREPFAYFDGEYMGPHHLDDLGTGSYTLLVTTADSNEILDWSQFEILECMTAVSGCRSVTFTNPPANPALRVTYGAGEDDASDDEPFDDSATITVRPGESRTVSTQRRVAGWEASRVVIEGQRRSFGGEDYDLGVSQHCGDTMTRSAIRCAAGARATADFWFTPPRDLPVQFKLFEFHELVDSDTVGADRHLRLKLRVDSELFSLRAYTADAVLPYDLMYFQVEPCLRVRPTCDGLTMTNSDDYAATVRYRIDDGRDQKIKIGTGRTKRIAVPEGSALSWTLPHPGYPQWTELLAGVDEGGTVSPLSSC